jgi:hypothetical protein
MSKLKKDKALELIQGLADGVEVIIRTPEEESTFLDNYKEAEIERAMKPKVGQIYDRMDADLFEHSGIRKEEREKTYDYAKRIITAMKSKSDNADVKKLEAEVERLKKDGPSGDLLRELENVRTSAAKREAEFAAQLQETNAKIARKDIEMSLNDGMRGFKFRTDIPQAVLNNYIETAKSSLATQAKIVDGKIVFTDKDGIAVNDQTTWQPMTAEQMLKQKLTDVIDAGHQGQGAGTDKPRTAKDATGKEYPIMAIPSAVNSRARLTKHLQEAGIASGTKEFDGAYEHYGKDLPLA